MPKRTTSEQQLVKKIYQAMAVAGGTVEESAEEYERGRTTKREIDLLLTRMIWGTSIRIAVEVRGRKRGDTIEWLDGLVGKYKDMNIQKIIAISKSGFSEGAYTKARDENIEALTLEQALDLNWSGEFTKLGMARLQRIDELQSIHVNTDPPFHDHLPEDLDVGTQSHIFCKMREFTQHIYERSMGTISRKIDEKLQEVIPTIVLADLQSKTMLTDISMMPTDPRYLHLPDGSCRRILSFTFRMVSRLKLNVHEVEHHVLGDPALAVASVGTFEGKDANDITRLTVVQTAEEPGKARLFIDTVLEASVKKPARRKRMSNKRGRLEPREC